ncbi:MAG: DNA-binding response regulator, partial [Candidatus Dadabacteria bacterium]
MARPKVLLVDADIKNRQMLEISLKKGGFTVTATEHGEKALQLLDTYRPDLIISDIDLAGSMDGFLFCQLLKDQSRAEDIPFIFLTSRKAVEDKIKGLELGVDDYLTKPIYLKEVLARARIIIDRKRQENIDSDTGTQSGQFQGDLSQMS